MPLSDLKSKYSKKEIKYLTLSKDYRLIMRYYDTHRHEPHHTLLYGFLCLIYDGFNTLEQIKFKMKLIFISATKQLVIGDDDIEEYYQKAKRHKLIHINSENTISLTNEGKKLVEFSYFWNLHTSYWMRIFFSKQAVMVISLIILIILASLKIFVGLSLASQGMITEGFENLTDLIKIGIIAIIGLKLKKDKLASIIIVLIMVITGGLLISNSIEVLFNPNPIKPTVQAYIVGFLSIIFNTALMFLKGIVGRISGNLSLLSDSKDSELNVKLSVGVLIGLTFAIFEYYFVDAIIGIIISILIIKEGIQILYELTKNEENFDITSLKVFADNIYDNRLTGYILGSVRQETISSEQLIKNFEQGLFLGRLYYEGFADFFYKELGTEIAEKHINKLIEGRVLEKFDDHLMLTPKGLKMFYKAKIKEFKERIYKIDITSSFLKQHLLCIIFLVLFGLLIIFTPQINSWFSNL